MTHRIKRWRVWQTPESRYGDTVVPPPSYVVYRTDVECDPHEVGDRVIFMNTYGTIAEKTVVGDAAEYMVEFKEMK